MSTRGARSRRPSLSKILNSLACPNRPPEFTMTDEIYQMKNFSRDKCRLLMRLDASKLDLTNPRVHRTDRDFAVTWAEMYGKGRVYYSTLGHVSANWDDPRLQSRCMSKP